MTEIDRARLMDISRYCVSEMMYLYAEYLKELAESEDREERYRKALIDIRDNWTDVGIIKERARSALGSEQETKMHTNGGKV